MSYDRTKRGTMPNPWVPDFSGSHAWVLSGSAGNLGTVGTGVANQALYIPIVFPRAVTLVGMDVLGGNTTGNYDIGLYDQAYSAIARKGSTALAAAVLPLTISSYRVTAGVPYYFASTLSNTGGRFRGYGLSVVGLAGMGCAIETSALPLPATMTPATVVTVTTVPLVSFRFNDLIP